MRSRQQRIDCTANSAVSRISRTALRRALNWEPLKCRGRRSGRRVVCDPRRCPPKLAAELATYNQGQRRRRNRNDSQIARNRRIVDPYTRWPLRILEGNRNELAPIRRRLSWARNPVRMTAQVRERPVEPDSILQQGRLAFNSGPVDRRESPPARVRLSCQCRRNGPVTAMPRSSSGEKSRAPMISRLSSCSLGNWSSRSSRSAPDRSAHPIFPRLRRRKRAAARQGRPPPPTRAAPLPRASRRA